MSKISSNRESDLTHSPASDTSPANQANSASTPDSPPRRAPLSPQQEQALEWLMSGGTITEAASFAGVTRQTISRWLRTDPEFSDLYEAWREETRTAIEARIAAVGELALDAVIHHIRSTGNLQASQFLLKTLLGQRKTSPLPRVYM